MMDDDVVTPEFSFITILANSDKVHAGSCKGWKAV